MSTADRFMDRFAGLRRAYGNFVVASTNKKSGKVVGRARTIRGTVTEDRWRDHLSGKMGLGIVPITDGGVTRFGALDVDVFDVDLEALCARVVELKLPLVVCRTKSGGAHLYLFVRDYVDVKLVRERLIEWAVHLGYPDVEIFPKQVALAGNDDVGNWINMPYFGGNATTRYAVREGRRLDTETFLKYADEIATTVEILETFRLDTDDALADGPPCLQTLASTGFPEGTRNKALFNFGVFCKIKYGDEWEVRVDEFNRRYMRPPLASEEVAVLTKSLGRKDYAYTCKEAPIKGACNRAICVKRRYGVGSFQRDSGVTMDNLVKILTKPPTYVLNVDGQRLRLDTSEDLITQTRFIRCCVDELSIMPHTVSRSTWEDAIRKLLERVEEVEAPPDAGASGQFLYFLEQFCVERAAARDKEELLIGKSYTVDGVTYFKSSDMLLYMERRKFTVTAKDAWKILREEGAVTRQFKIKSRCVRCWGVKAPVAQDVTLDVPDTDGDEF